MIPGSQSQRDSGSYGRKKASPIRRLVSIVVIVSILGFITGNRQGLLRLRQLQQDQLRLAGQINLLSERTGELKTERAHLEVDLAYIEQLAREKYRMVYRGEKIFRVVPRQTPASLPPQGDN